MELHGKAGSSFRKDESQVEGVSGINLYIIWDKVQVEKMEECDRMTLQKIIVSRPRSFILEKLLDDVYGIRKPKRSEYELREQVIQNLNDIAKKLYGNSDSCPVVEEFGSYLMDLFTIESDLDLSINFRSSSYEFPSINFRSSSYEFPRNEEIKTLEMFENKLRSLQNEGYVQKVRFINRPRVPIIKFVDTATSVSCDISVENRIGISKSLIIRLITSIDERFPKLCVLMKAWAKAHDINNPRDRTLNSFTIVLLVAFHLQTRDPPILPPFSEILKDGVDPVFLNNSVRNFQNYGSRNTETLAGLFVSFLIKLASVEKLWQKGLCASPYLGHWIHKTWDTNIATMSVEDFLDRAQNVAGRVGKQEVKKIYYATHCTIENVSRFMNFKIEEFELKGLLFGIDYMNHPYPNSTMNNFNLKGVMDRRAGPNWSTWPLPTGHWGAPQPQAVTAGPEILWAHQSVYDQPMMGGPGWTQGWGGGASPSSSGGTNGVAFMDDHFSWPQEMQPTTDPFGRRFQQYPYAATHTTPSNTSDSPAPHRENTYRGQPRSGQQRRNNGPRPNRGPTSQNGQQRPPQPRNGPWTSYSQQWPPYTPWWVGPTGSPAGWAPPPYPYPTQAGWASPWQLGFQQPSPRPSGNRPATGSTSRTSPQAHITYYDPLQPTDIGEAFQAVPTVQPTEFDPLQPTDIGETFHALMMDSGEPNWIMDMGASNHLHADSGLQDWEDVDPSRQ
ncbi:protein HESO1 isoform X1 [Helianthus annuus]|uniref:protein HESO1 isoform X1 n=1 Tax=Helianthus annuus TaxID=4232 RepID=UPI000B8EE8E0|nr:protein HESO1 isoform X1 [Helianthus annuus]